MARKKDNLISLHDYRNKKQKLGAKDKRKAASDESTAFTTEEYPKSGENLKSTNNNKPAQIYYMENYLKTKKKESEEIIQNREENHSTSQIKTGRILFLSDHKRKKQQAQNKPKKTGTQMTEPISLQDYRDKKQKQQKSFAFVKQTVSYGAVALAMLLALNIFYPKQDQNLNNRTLASVKESSQDTKKEQHPIKRNLSSLLTPSDKKEGFNSEDWAQQLKNIDFTKQQAVFGKKPDSSDYKGF